MRFQLRLWLGALVLYISCFYLLQGPLAEGLTDGSIQRRSRFSQGEAICLKQTP